jgi:hypothetical protein
MINLFFSNFVFKKIIFSFFITILISVLGGLFFLNFGLDFWISSVFFFILQIIGFYFYGEHIKRKNAYIKAELELQAAFELKKISAEVVCPCDKKLKNTIIIDMNDENTYICSQCDKKISVIVETKTFLKTDPITKDPLLDQNVLNNFEKAIKDPSHNDRF